VSVNSSGLAGITLQESNYNELRANHVYSNWLNGFMIIKSSKNMLINNNVEKNKFGIFLQDSTNNTLEDNNISENSEGICLQNASGNKIYTNEINSNERYGIDTCKCKDNNEYNMNQIKNNGIGFYIDNSNDNITGDNLLEGNEIDIEKAPAIKPLQKLLIIGVAFILFIAVSLIFLKNKN